MADTFCLTNYGGEIMKVKMTKELNAEKYLVKNRVGANKIDTSNPRENEVRACVYFCFTLNKV